MQITFFIGLADQHSVKNFLYNHLVLLVRFFLIIIFCTTTRSLFAETEESEIQPEKKEITVIAKKEPHEIERSSSSRSVIELKDTDGRFVTVDELIEKEAGVRIRRYGGMGAYSTASIRGSTSNQVNVYIDGIPLNHAGMGEVNLSALNTDSISEIEIRRNGDTFGSPIGGALHLKTAKERETPSGFKIGSGIGSFDTFRVIGEAWGGEAFQYDVSTKAESSRQNFKFHNDNGTPVINTIDDFEDTRENANYKHYFATARFGWHGFQTDFKLLNDTAKAENGLPGPIARQTKRTRAELLRNTTGLSTDTKGLFADWFRLQNRVFFTEYQNQFHDPDQEYDPTTPHSFARLRSYGLNVEPTIYLLDYYQTIKLFLGTEREGFWKERRNRFEERVERLPAKTRGKSTLRFEDEAAFFDDRLILTASAEYQQIVDRFPDQDYRFRSVFDEDPTYKEHNLRNFSGGVRGVVYREQKNDIYLKLHASTGSRLPLFVELFGQPGAIIGNTRLVPEKADTIEGGFGMQLSKPAELPLQADLEIIGFERRVTDLILFVPNSQFSVRPENVDKANIRGVESSLKLKAFDHIKLYTNYTWQKAINESDIRYVKGKYLAYQPLHDFAGGLSWFNDFIETGIDASYQGALYKDRTNDPFNYQPGYWLYGLFFRWQVFGKDEKKKDLRISFDIKNLLNRRAVEISGYPLPGRAVYLSISYRF